MQTPNSPSSSATSAAAEFVHLWQSGASDAPAISRLRSILARTPLSGRMIHGTPADPDFGTGLLSSDRWKRLSWCFAPDALEGFLGKDTYEVCLMLGFGRSWLDAKIPEGKRFKLAIFPSEEVDAKPATWEGVADLVKSNYPEVWLKVAAHLPQIQSMSFADIEELAGYNIEKANMKGRKGGAHDTEGESEDLNYTSLQRLLKRDGTLVQIRQFLYDELGLKKLFTGDGSTINDDGTPGPREYLAKNVALESIEGCVVVDAPVDKYLAGQNQKSLPQSQDRAGSA